MLWEFLKAKMHETPEQTISEGSNSISYKELENFVEYFAHQLSGQKCCAIYCDSEMAASVAVLCCFAANVTAVPLAKKYGEKHCEKIIQMIGPTAVISDIDGELKLYKLDNPSYNEPTHKPALIMCTSGTSGKPKGVMLSENNIRTNLEDISAYFHVGQSDTLLIARPIYHCAVLTGEFLLALVKNIKIVFTSGSFNPIELLKIIRNQEITVLGATPTLLNMLIKFKKEQDHLPLKSLVVSGECLAPSIAQRLCEAFPYTNIYHVYGLTEACPRVCYLPPELFKKHPDYIGIPLNSVSVEIRDANDNVLPNGNEGLLWVKGNNIMIGYYNAPEHTAKVLKNGWLCTGDIAVKNDFGLIKVLGRSDDLIICAGINIYPAEIEAAMLTDRRTKEVLVYGERDQNFITRLKMDISGDFRDSDEVYKVCRRVLIPYQIPATINLMKELSKNASGKVIRKNDRI